ncbi:hypothetical protein K491DRAFT_379976 [Lophiostoma macrostomum CBS 122681]|uniref:Uncharacterized protein n=1 Tax=Lophiostoma macrostomum CBS 122681 TaxID=1314788 RepID=A0A6A6T966_9PLEO|nr:hypothetical protein K491DRAFT_379976 [Lophiostoma macrostomum CBS 122681]
MSSLESLPEDVKRLICDELAATESQSLRILWQVSRTWHAVAEPFVYRGLDWAVNLGDGPSPKFDARRLVEDDVAKKYLEHARYIHIHTTFYPRSLYSNDSTDEDTSTEKAPWTGLSPIRPSFNLSEPISPNFDSVFSSDGENKRSEAEAVWKPVVTALSRFKHFTDIVLQIRSRFPPNLMAVIERYHKTCRLHLRNFRFKSLHEDVTDPDERALACSQNLHSLSIKYVYRDSRGTDDHNDAAALRTVALSKNLKHVRMLGCRPASSPMLARSRGRPVEPWKGFIPAIEDVNDHEGFTQAKTKLESLSFLGYRKNVDIKKLGRWEQIADLSHLRALSCSTGKEDFLRLVAAQHNFPRLEDLGLTLEPNKRDNLEGWEPAVEQFFASLAPLTSLRLSGHIHGPLINVIVERHGATLEELSLKPYTDAYDMPSSTFRITTLIMELLGSTAPKLASLNLTLKRSMGDRTETRCYEALGNLQNLKHVKLSLDCSNPSAWNLTPEEDWDDFDKATQTDSGSNPKYYNGHLKAAIVNSALDEDLVRQIWDVINENRTKDTVQTLDIYTYGGSSFSNSHPGDLMNIVQHVSRHYTITANATVGGDIEIVEVSKKQREERDASQRKHEQVMLEKWGHKG